MATASLFLPVVLNSCIGERQSNIEKKNQKEERNCMPKRVTEILWKEILKSNKQTTEKFE